MTDVERIAELEKEVASLKALVAELQARLKQDSHNSNWSSSHDKNRRTRSQRDKSDRQAGGQAGHSGQTLKAVDRADKIELHQPVACSGCGHHFTASELAQCSTVSSEQRQVFDIPPMRLEVTQHHTSCMTCPACGEATCGVFPAQVKHAVQYGAQIKALLVALNQQHMVPFLRLSGFAREQLQAHLSAASIVAWVQEAGQAVATQVVQIQTGLQQSAVVHYDETGQYISGQRAWSHVAGTKRLTLYRPHAKRGCAGMDALGVLPGYQGIAVHDGFSSYKQYGCQHALCNAHHLRELTAVHEVDGQAWAAAFKTLLCGAKAEVDQARRTGLSALPASWRQTLAADYQALIDKAYQANPPPPGGWPAGKRGPQRKPKALNLAERLDKQRTQVLAFVDNFNVPFDNNLVERDIRMLKVQQKVSGCFRSWEGARAAADLRSYLSTMLKQGHTVTSLLNSLFSGNLLPVALAE